MGKKSRVKTQKSGSGATTTASPKEMMNLISELLQSMFVIVLTFLCQAVFYPLDLVWVFSNMLMSVTSSQNAAVLRPPLVKSGKNISKSEAWSRRSERNRKVCPCASSFSLRFQVPVNKNLCFVSGSRFIHSFWGQQGGQLRWSDVLGSGERGVLWRVYHHQLWDWGLWPSDHQRHQGAASFGICCWSCRQILTSKTPQILLFKLFFFSVCWQQSLSIILIIILLCRQRNCSCGFPGRC